MCHYRHHAHPDPFFLPGLQDITVHVDFTAIAEAGTEAGLDFLGYTNQATFLLNCGLVRLLETASVAQRAHALKLVNEHEMGELFKVLLLSRSDDWEPLGFATGDRSHTL